MAKRTTTKTANCRRCHALLTNPRRVALGIGAHCERMERREAAVQAAGYKPHQIASAQELIEDGAIVPLRPGLFVVVSSDGTETYETTSKTCGCPAFESGRKCYHRAAVTLLAA
ncbi:MAG: SWIM zinc finger family protein [Pseudonocardia sp.]